MMYQTGTIDHWIIVHKMFKVTLPFGGPSFSSLPPHLPPPHLLLRGYPPPTLALLHIFPSFITLSRTGTSIESGASRIQCPFTTIHHHPLSPCQRLQFPPHLSVKPPWRPHTLRRKNFFSPTHLSPPPMPLHRFQRFFHTSF